MQPFLPADIIPLHFISIIYILEVVSNEGCMLVGQLSKEVIRYRTAILEGFLSAPGLPRGPLPISQN